MSKKSSVYKLLTLVIVSMMILTLVSACNSGKSNNEASSTPSAPAATNSPSPSQEPSNSPEASEAPAELEVYAFDNGGGLNFDGEAIRYIEEKTNTKLHITTPGGAELDEKLNVLMASGDYPDIIQFGSDQTELKYADSGVLLPLSDYFDQAPNLKQSRPQEVWEAMKHDDGKIYSVGILTPSVHFVAMYRQDWLDKFGLKVPTTLDEYYQVADAVSNQDPDGNGKKDTYAFGATGALGRYFDHIFGAFGVLPNYWMLRDGNIVNGSVQPEAKEALKFLNKMYKNGLIDPEFITDTTARNKDKYKAGVYGAQGNFIWMFDTNNLNGYYKPFHEANPDGAWIEGPVLQAAGTAPSVGMRKLSQKGWLRTAITKNSKNKEAALRVLDWLASEEGNMFTNYGVEGKHYEIGADGVVKVTVSTEDAHQYGIHALKLVETALFEQTTPKFKQVKAFTEEHALSDPADGILVEETGKYQSDLNLYTDSEYFKMIAGEVPIDGGFEKFVEEYNKRGGTALTAALDKAYKARQ